MKTIGNQATTIGLVVMLLMFTSAPLNIMGQTGVGIGTNNPNAQLDVSSSDEGILIPRVALTSTSSASPLSSPTISELVYNTATVSDVTPGFYYWDGSQWVRFAFSGNDDDKDWYEQGTTTSPDNINDDIYTQGNVGIGIDAPVHKLHVDGDMRIDAGGSKPIVFTSGNFGAGNTTDMIWNEGDVGFNQEEFSMYNANNNAAQYRYFALFYTADGDASGLNIRKGGNVGIGDKYPDSKLHVSSGTSGDAELILEADTDNDNENDNPFITFKQDASTVNGFIGLEGDAGTRSSGTIDNALVLGSESVYTSLQFITDDNVRMTIEKDGNVGVGTTTPNYNLDVAGNTSTTGDFYGNIHVDDTRDVDDAPTAFDKEVAFDFKKRGVVGVGGSGTFSGMMTIAPWSGNSGDASHQINFNEGGLFWRQGQPDAATWGDWYRILTAADGSGTTNYLAKWTPDGNTLGIGVTYDDGTNVGIGTTSPLTKLEVNGTAMANAFLYNTAKIENCHDCGTSGREISLQCDEGFAMTGFSIEKGSTHWEDDANIMCVELPSNVIGSSSNGSLGGSSGPALPTRHTSNCSILEIATGIEISAVGGKADGDYVTLRCATVSSPFVPVAHEIVVSGPSYIITNLPHGAACPAGMFVQEFSVDADSEHLVGSMALTCKIISPS